MYEAGIVLEGGGMRGFFTAGVLDCLMDNDIYFRNLYGVSAGACHGCSYASRQRGRALELNIKYRGDKRYAGMYSLLTTGDYFGKDFQLNVIPKQLVPYDYEAFRNSGMNFYATATNCRTGKAEYLKIEDMDTEIDKIWASSTLPLISRMVTIDGEEYLDGGVADSIPVGRAIKDGNKRVVAVLTRDIAYRKKQNELLPLIKIKYRNYPKLVEAVENRHRIYNKTLAYIRRLESDGKIVVIRPPQRVEIGRLEKDTAKLKQLYQTGYDETEKMLDRIRDYLNIMI